MRAKLSVDSVKKATAHGRDKIIWDIKTKGFFLRVYPRGAKRFGVYFRTVDGAQRWVTLLDGEVFDEDGKVRLEEARRAAQKELGAARDEAKRVKRGDVPTIQEGAKEALGLTRARESTKKGYQYSVDQFCAWLARKHPRVKTWAHLRPSILEAYILDLERPKIIPNGEKSKGRKRAGATHDTIRLAVGFIRFAWRRMHADFPELVLPPPVIRLPKKQRKEIECLEPVQVAALLDWLRTNRPRLYVMGCLQALAGLRMLEAAALRYEDVDLKAGTIRVATTELHTPKNDFSERTIPVCTELLEALRQRIEGPGQVKAIRGELFHNDKEEPWTLSALTQTWRRALEAIAAKPVQIVRKTGTITVHQDGLGDSAYSQIPAHKLRAAFLTMASRSGAPDRILKAYAGHAPEDILGRHYRKITLEELRTVSRTMEGWRKLICEDKEGLQDETTT